MNRILIIGAGFAGLSAARELAKATSGLEITLIDKKGRFDFLPMLPDVIGRGVSARFLSNAISALAGGRGVQFIQEEAVSADLPKNTLRTQSKTLDYDYLVVACGSETNFYGQKQLARYAYKLDNLEDAQRILQALRANRYDTFIVAGAGYTGIEAAANLRLLLNKSNSKKRVIIVELASSILGPLPGWMKEYVAGNIREFNIDTLLNCKIESIDRESLKLSNGQSFSRAMLIWTAGVKASDFIFSLDTDKTPQGRIKVDEYLRFRDNCFALGDAAQFSYRQRPLRMAVQFSIAQGRIAAMNILRLIRGRPLRSYRPLDFGYVIPMANNKSCGNIFGIDMKGYLPTLLHYLMCIYRSFSLSNKFGIIKQLTKRGQAPFSI
jgi:NADH dehydrogenase